MAKYKVGDGVFYFDSFTGKIVGACIKGLISEQEELKNIYGDIIEVHHYVVGYELTTGVQIKEHLLFDNPFELVDNYRILFDDLRKQLTLG